MNLKVNYYRADIYSTKIMGVKVDFISLKRALYLIEKWVENNKKYQITTPNPEQIILANKNYRFKKIINNSALSIADGVGLLLAVKFLEFSKKKQIHRLTGVDLMEALCKLAGNKGWRVFLLGGRSKIAEKVAIRMKEKINALKVDFFCGPVDITKITKKEEEKIISKINSFRPHLLFVAFGAPKQEIWIAKNLKKLKVNIAMGVGGAFDYLSGRVKRAPLFLRKVGLEWLWRLFLQPWRIKRQLSLLKFLFLLCKCRVFTFPFYRRKKAL